MLENPGLEQNKHSPTSTGNYKNAHDSIRLLKWICYYDRSFYENINFYDVMCSIAKSIKKIKCLCIYLVKIQISS